MNALEAASLVMIPSGYEDGTLGSLKPTDGTGDFTFTRGSNISATRVNADGYIEKGYENLLLQSNSFLTSPWDSREAVVSSGESGYDNTNDAWLVLDTTGSGIHRIAGGSLALSGVNSVSVYAKAYSNSRYLGLAGFGLAGADEMPVFDLENGTIDTPSTSTIFKDANITSVGGGWYRCSMMFVYSGTSALSITLCNSATDNGITGYTYTGTGLNGFYIQDAMINQGMVAYPYVETTTAPVAGGILEDMPRLDYSNGSCPSLLLEPERTNLITHSEYLDGSGWSDTGITLTPNAATSPSGLQNAYLATNNDGNQKYIIPSVSISDNTDYSYSVFVKKGNDDIYQIKIFNSDFSESLQLAFDFSNPQSPTITDGVTGGSYLDSDVKDFGNDWYRIELSFTSFDTSLNIRNYIGTLNGANNATMYYYGFQLEQGSYPTSYIPTYGVSQTRLGDDVNLNLSNAWDSTGSWTMFFELERMNDDYFNALDIMRFDGTGDLYIKDRRTSVNLVIIGSAGASTANTGTINRGDTYKIAVKWDGTTTKAFFNGGEILFNNPSSGAYGFNSIPVNRWHIKHKEVYFPTALSDDKCIELTTI